MDLQELLGADFKEGITADEVNSILEKRLLATGRYENKEKVDAERKASKALKEELENKIKSKMTEDELSKQEVEDLKKELEKLRLEKIEDNKKYSRTVSEANIAEVKDILEIKEKDKDFEEFITNISVENSETSSKTSKYFASMVKKAYEKGKAERTKQELGEMGSMVIGKDGKLVDKDKQFISDLIANTMAQQPQNKTSNFI